MADLVEYGPAQQVGPGNSGVRIELPLHVLPGEPVADLRVSGKQQDLPAVDELDRQYQAGVVRGAVELESEFGRRAHIVIVDPSPRLIVAEVVAGEKFLVMPELIPRGLF